MDDAEARLAEVEDLMRRLPAAKRDALLKSIAELFVENIDRYRPVQVNLFDRLFSHLVGDAGKEAAASLARRLADIANAPVTTINRLALDDDITVAEPVLLRSACIEESILIDIARAKGQTHLLAIACRTPLAETIVDLLIARGDEVVARYVANNQGARISQGSAATLVDRAKRDDALAILVGQRNDIPAHLLVNLPRRAPTAASTAMA